MRTITSILSTKRSGHHAVIRWLYEGLGRPVIFYNNINGRYAKSGEQTSYDRDGYSHVQLRKCAVLSDSDTGHDTAMNFEGKLPQTIARILHKIDTSGGPAHFEQYIILRDPLNTLASCARRSPARQHPKTLIKFYEQALALCALITEAGNPQYLSPDKLIAYNRWLCDAAYRRNLAERIGMVRIPDLPSKVSHHGGGSSFSGDRLDNPKALLLRWRDMADEPLFLSPFLDAGLREIYKLYASTFEDTYAPDCADIDALAAKAGNNTQAKALYHNWLAPLRANPDNLAAVQKATGTPGYVPAKLGLRLALRRGR